MLMLAAFAITYLINTPDLISFQVKLILGTLTAVLTSIWLLSLIYPFQLQMKYDASRQADLQTVQVLDAFSAETIPPAVTFIAECGATSAPDLLFMRGQSLNLSRLCESGFLMGSVYGEGDDPLSEIQRFERDGRAYIVGFAFADYAKTMNQFALPIALVMVGSALIIIFLLPLVFYVNLVKPLASLSDGLQQINQGRLDVTVPVQTNDELGLLAKSFNEMAAELRTSVSDLENQFAESLRAEKSLREQKEQLRALSARLAEVEEAERRKLGHELHDQAGQNLTALSLTIKTVRTQLAMKSQDPSTVKQLTERLDDASELVRETTQRIRNVMEDLQPPALDEFGLPAALHWYATRFTPRTGIPVEITATDPAPRLSPQAEVAFFRIAQEALTNVAHHAQATQVRINMEITSGCTRMTIFDNGQGFDPRQPESDDKRSHWGLRLMAERAEAVGGTCRIESSAQQGTQIIVEVHS
jgi:signal transduction histidine kinase